MVDHDILLGGVAGGMRIFEVIGGEEVCFFELCKISRLGSAQCELCNDLGVNEGFRRLSGLFDGGFNGFWIGCLLGAPLISGEKVLQ